jgi:hypothetical protein
MLEGKPRALRFLTDRRSPTRATFFDRRSHFFAATPWPGLDRIGLKAELEQSGDRRDVDAEAPRDLASRPLKVIDSGDNSFSEIVRQRFHGPPPTEVFHPNRVL